jgi:hypothetical protein
VNQKREKFEKMDLSSSPPSSALTSAVASLLSLCMCHGSTCICSKQLRTCANVFSIAIKNALLENSIEIVSHHTLIEIIQKSVTSLMKKSDDSSPLVNSRPIPTPISVLPTGGGRKKTFVVLIETLAITLSLASQTYISFLSRNIVDYNTLLISLTLLASSSSSSSSSSSTSSLSSSSSSMNDDDKNASSFFTIDIYLRAIDHSAISKQWIGLKTSYEREKQLNISHESSQVLLQQQNEEENLSIAIIALCKKRVEVSTLSRFLDMFASMSITTTPSSMTQSCDVSCDISCDIDTIISNKTITDDDIESETENISFSSSSSSSSSLQPIMKHSSTLINTIDPPVVTTAFAMRTLPPPSCYISLSESSRIALAEYITGVINEVKGYPSSPSSAIQCAKIAVSSSSYSSSSISSSFSIYTSINKDTSSSSSSSFPLSKKIIWSLIQIAITKLQWQLAYRLSVTLLPLFLSIKKDKKKEEEEDDDEGEEDESYSALDGLKSIKQAALSRQQTKVAKQVNSYIEKLTLWQQQQQQQLHTLEKKNTDLLFPSFLVSQSEKDISSSSSSYSSSLQSPLSPPSGLFISHHSSSSSSSSIVSSQLTIPFDNLSIEEKSRLTKLSISALHVLRADIFAAAGASWFHEKGQKSSNTKTTKTVSIQQKNSQQNDTKKSILSSSSTQKQKQEPNTEIDTSNVLLTSSSFIYAGAEYEERCIRHALFGLQNIKLAFCYAASSIRLQLYGIRTLISMRKFSMAKKVVKYFLQQQQGKQQGHMDEKKRREEEEEEEEIVHCEEVIKLYNEISLADIVLLEKKESASTINDDKDDTMKALLLKEEYYKDRKKGFNTLSEALGKSSFSSWKKIQL